MNFFTILGIIIMVVGISAIIIVAMYKKPSNKEDVHEKPSIVTKAWSEDMLVNFEEDMSPVSKYWNEPMVKNEDSNKNEANDNNNGNNNSNEKNDYGELNSNYENINNKKEENEPSIKIEPSYTDYTVKYELPNPKPKSKYPPKSNYESINTNNITNTPHDKNEANNGKEEDKIEKMDYFTSKIESSENISEEIDYADSDDLIGSLIGDYSKNKSLDYDTKDTDDTKDINKISENNVDDSTKRISEKISKHALGNNNTISNSTKSTERISKYKNVKVPKKNSTMPKKIKNNTDNINTVNSDKDAINLSKSDLSDLSVGDYIIFNYDDTTYSSKILATNHDHIKIKYRFNERWIKKTDVKKVLNRKKY
ncbi:MAG: hypothetical protein ACRCVG_04850 [Methanobacteriaceae archaeon]